MPKTRVILAIVYIIVSLAVAYIILFGDEGLSMLVLKLVVAIGVALIGVLAGLSIILSSRYASG